MQAGELENRKHKETSLSFFCKLIISNTYHKRYFVTVMLSKRSRKSLFEHSCFRALEQTRMFIRGSGDFRVNQISSEWRKNKIYSLWKERVSQRMKKRRFQRAASKILRNTSRIVGLRRAKFAFSKISMEMHTEVININAINFIEMVTRVIGKSLEMQPSFRWFRQ